MYIEVSAILTLEDPHCGLDVPKKQLIAAELAAQFS